MSSKAITSDIILRLYCFNNSEGRSEIGHSNPSESVAHQWGNPRRRLLVHSVLTLAFLCLLRIDEVLNLQFQDLQYRSQNQVVVTLHTRKTHPHGGEAFALWPTRIVLTKFLGSKPYDLWLFNKEDRGLCAVSALSRWIQASGLGGNPTGYIFRPVGLDGKAPSIFKNLPIVSTLVVIDDSASLVCERRPHPHLSSYFETT
jgi:hypothetical protein